MALSITRLYDDGQELTEAHLDAICDSVETFVNVTGLTGENIQDNAITAAELQTSSVTAGKIASDAVTTVKILDANVTLAKLAAEITAKLVPTGSITSYMGVSAPTGWLLCDGAEVSRTTYADLYAVLGNKTGTGDGTTTFKVPDLRGRFLRMVDGIAARDPDNATRTAMNTGGATGNNIGSVQDDEVGSHSHGGSGATSTSGVFESGTGYIQRDVAQENLVTMFNSGAETRPVNAYVNMIIKI